MEAMQGGPRRRGVLTINLNRQSRRAEGRRRASLAPIIESLEDRRLLSGSVTVTTFADVNVGNTSSITALNTNNNGGNGISLREAIIASNNTPATKASPNIITVPAGTYTLTMGELDVTNDVMITSNASGTPTIEAGTSSLNGTSKIFSFNPYNDSTFQPTVSAGFAVSLSGLTLQFGKNPILSTISGRSEGGAFDFDAGNDGGGSLTLSNVTISNNQTTGGDGGGIALFDGGLISITNSTISNNTANGTSTGGGGSGGGIFIGENVTYTSGNAVGLPLNVTITGTTISGNKTAGNAAGSGGGIISEADSGTTGVANTIALHGDMISGNSAPSGQDGGGVDVYGGLTVDQGTVISGNSSGRWGGGLFLSGTATITNTTIINNSASGGLGGGGSNEGGGGIFANDNLSNVTVTNSRIVGNTAMFGGSQLDGNGKGTSSGGGILNAANNWFGTNTPLASFFGPGVQTLTTSPFLKETFTASPTTLGAGKTSTLTAAITTNSVGATGFTVPNGTPVTFSGGSIGSVNPSSTSTTSGVATSTFTAGSTAGTGNVSSTIDNQTLSVPITVVGTPTANTPPSPVSVPHDGSGTSFTLTGSDPNTPALPLTFAMTSSPSHGTLTSFNTSTGAVTYKPTAGYHGTDSFTFTVSNGTATSSPATVTLSVAVGTPTAIAQTFPVAHDSSGTPITLTSTDDDSPALSMTYAFTQPAHGSVTVSGGTGSPTVIYTPTAGYHGTDSFTFTANNGTNTSAPASVTLNVAVGTPTANAQSVSTAQGTAVNITLTGSDDDTPSLASTTTFAIVAGHGPTNGTISNFNPSTGTLTYTPNAGYSGPDTFQFTVNNGTNTSAPATVGINVVPGTATVSGTVGVSWGTSGTATLLTNADGLRLLPTGRTTDLPWLGINKLTITLSQAEPLSPSDVTVTGVNLASYGLVSISGSGTTYTLTLAQPINSADRVTVTIANANITSFTRRLDVLPGDFNDDGLVNGSDAVLIRNEYLGLNGGAPTLFGDLDGNGVVDVNDYNLVRRLIGTKLP